MQPHQEQVVAELKELSERREKLSAFIASNQIFSALPVVEKMRLRRQLIVMTEYANILQERIDHFPRS
jgi:hypothetical protein